MRENGLGMDAELECFQKVMRNDNLVDNAYLIAVRFHDFAALSYRTQVPRVEHASTFLLAR